MFVLQDFTFHMAESARNWYACTFPFFLVSDVHSSTLRVSTCNFMDNRWFVLCSDTLEKSIAIVKCGPNWGTATLVDEQSGTFITCAHVVTMVYKLSFFFPYFTFSSLKLSEKSPRISSNHEPV